jgi:hypothetical protein
MPVRHLLRYVGLTTFALAFVTGCGGGPPEPPRHPVSGQVKLRGKPLPEATVSFHPQQQGARLLYAVTDPEGRFKITFREPGDGAPAGKYLVTVVRHKASKDGDEIVRNGPNELPQRYENPGTSGLSVDIVDGPNELPVIDLK